MNQQLVLIGIGLVVAAFILRPLLRGTRSGGAGKPASPPPAAATSEELNELELDRAMGRVSDADYARWRQELEIAPPSAETAVSPPSDATSRAEALVRQWREAPRPVCSRCGLRPEPAARFCSNCGASVAP